MELPIGLYMKNASTSPNVKCIYITSMQHMDPSKLCYLMLMTVYIGIAMRNIHIGLFPFRSHNLRTIIFHWIKLGMLHPLL